MSAVRRLPLAVLAGAACLMVGSLGAAVAAGAQASGPPGTPLAVEIDRAYQIELPVAAKTVFVANPAIADVQITDPHRIMVYGRKAGCTTIHVTSADGVTSAYSVTVLRPLRSATDAVAAAAPRASVHVSAAPRGLAVTGQVETPREAAQVKAAAEQFVDPKENVNLAVQVTGETQVNLQVRIVEVSRQVTNTLGFNWNTISNNGSTILGLAAGRDILSATGAFTRNSALNPANSIGFGYRSPGGSTNVNGVLDALQSEGMVTVLAQPNLTAASGQTARFLAGGEFPVPVSQQNNAITVEWKKFGVALEFTPTVLDPGRLSINVRPEVSEISDKGAVTINNLKIPGIAVRRAETTIELASGQSFAIAGLFQNNISSSVNQFPWLADLPVIGQLLRSSSFTHDQSELVIIVTPYIVRPVNQAAALHTPAEGLTLANALEEAVLGRTTGLPPEHPHLRGPAGFILEDKP